jgi:HTH-type transcriptional regulator / antitoxin HigA
MSGPNVGSGPEESPEAAPQQIARLYVVAAGEEAIGLAASLGAIAGFSPDYSVTPGEVLRIELDARGLTQAELASRTNLSAKHINQVIKGNATLSPEMALRLERALGIPSQVWNALEANYQDRQTRAKARGQLSRYEAWLRRFPLRELLARGVINKDDDVLTRVEKLLAFFEVADPDAYDRVWAEPVAAGFRRAQHADIDPYATAVWLKLGERMAEVAKCSPYDAQAFADLLLRLPALTLKQDDPALTDLRRECATVGVAVEFVSEVKGCRASGAARWLNPGKAMILLSGRYRYHDIIWFAFFHEASHLLLHPRRKMVVDLEDSGDDDDGQESAANDYAASILVPAPYAERLTEHTTATEAIRIAKEIGIHPGIIAGRLGYLYGHWPRYARIRRKIDVAAFAVQRDSPEPRWATPSA